MIQTVGLRRACDVFVFTRSALIAIAAADPAPAAVITWARGSTTLPAAQTPGARPAGGVDGGEPGLVDRAAEAGQQAVGMRDVAGPDEHAVRAITRPSVSSTPVSRSSSTTSRATSPSTTRTPRASSRTRSAGVSS